MQQDALRFSATREAEADAASSSPTTNPQSTPLTLSHHSLVSRVVAIIMCSDEGARRRLKPPKPLLPHEEPDDPDWPYAHGNLDPLGKFIGFAVMVVCFSLIAYFRYRQYLRDIVITPLDVAPIIAANASLPLVNPDRFWGTYR